MTITQRHKLILSSLASGLLMMSLSKDAKAGANPSSVIMKVYEMRVSAHADCSVPITVFRNASPTAQDMISNPSLGSGAIPNGTYPCIMLKISDVITYTPAANDGANCIAGTSYTRDIFRAGDPLGSVSPDGVAITATGTQSSPSEDDPWLYIRSGGSSNVGTCFLPTSGCPLANPLVVTGDHVGTFVTDFDGQINGSQNPCDLNAPVFAFR